MKVKIPLKIAHRLINHGPLVLISVFYKGRPNVQTVAWVMPIDYGKPKAAFVIGSDNYTYECLRHMKECVINIPNKALLKKVIGCGSVSGRNIDKFKKFNLTPLKAKTVKAPLIKECIGHLECKLIDEPKLVSRYDLFLANVTYAWAEKGVFKDFWLVNKAKAQTLHHLGEKHFALISGKSRVLNE